VGQQHAELVIIVLADLDLDHNPLCSESLLPEATQQHCLPDTA